MSMVMPRAFSSGRRSQSMPVRALTSEVLPWSMWPAVPRIRSRGMAWVPGGRNPCSFYRTRRHLDGPKNQVRLRRLDAEALELHGDLAAVVRGVVDDVTQDG